jgi:hypothetical protein
MANKPFVVPMPTPIDVAITQPAAGTGDPLAPDVSWVEFFLNQEQLTKQATRVVALAPLENQSAAILTTPLATGALSTGRYRVSYYARITTPATTSSSLSITIGWTNDLQACTKTVGPETGNTRGSVLSGSLEIECDSPGVITYATAYVSVGGQVMIYKLRFRVEKL